MHSGPMEPRGRRWPFAGPADPWRTCGTVLNWPWTAPLMSPPCTLRSTTPTMQTLPSGIKASIHHQEKQFGGLAPYTTPPRPLNNCVRVYYISVRRSCVAADACATDPEASRSHLAPTWLDCGLNVTTPGQNEECRHKLAVWGGRKEFSVFYRSLKERVHTFISHSFNVCINVLILKQTSHPWINLSLFYTITESPVL